MRFVTPEVVRIPLKDTVISKMVAEGEAQVEKQVIQKNWIEIKKELSKGEDSAMRSSGLRKLSQSDKEGGSAVDVDWKDLALGRVVMYLTDWSARDANDKPVKLTPTAIAELCTEDFEEIDEAIKAHVAALEEEKKVRSGKPQPALTSQ